MYKSRFLIFCAIAVLFYSSMAFAQNINYDKVWVQGESTTFETTFGGTNAQNRIIDSFNSIYLHLGHSNICDSAGNLQLVCDGYNLYNSRLDLIEDGDTIVPTLICEHNGWSNVAQSSIILPFSKGKYRVVTPTASDSQFLDWFRPDATATPFDLLLYNDVDMSANSNAGRVSNRMVPLLKGVKLSKSQMMACRHGDGISWWLLKQASDTNVIYKFLFTEDKVYGPYVQGFAEPHFDYWDWCGQSVFSKDGTRYATTSQYGHKIFVADFDRCNGNLSNPKVYDLPAPFAQNPNDLTERDSASNGLAFSPNGRFLYVSGFTVVQQLDLQDTNPPTAWTTLAGPDTTWEHFQGYSNIYPGPDDKLYIGNWNGYSGQMSVIENPDNKGSLANFCRKCLRFPGYIFQGITQFAGVGSPPCMPNYRLGAVNPICYPATIKSSQFDSSLFSLHPNPSRGYILVTNNARGTLQLFDMAGRSVMTFQLNSISKETLLTVENLLPGIYQYRFLSLSGQATVGKLVIVE